MIYIHVHQWYLDFRMLLLVLAYNMEILFPCQLHINMLDSLLCACRPNCNLLVNARDTFDEVITRKIQDPRKNYCDVRVSCASLNTEC